VPTFLSLEDVMALHTESISRFGGAHGVRDVGALESALATPQATMFGEYLYVSGTTRTLREHFADSARRLKERLDERLQRENRVELAQACFDFLPARALLDLAGWAEADIFAHS